MAFDSDTRNKLARMVAQARQLLTDEFTQQLQEIYGIQPDGTITPIEKLNHLDDEQAGTAKLLRERIDHLVSGMASEKEPVVAAIDRAVREQAFTILNRFAALRMCEERSLVEECVRAGMQSKGFKVYETVAGAALGDTYERYKVFLLCLFDEIAVDLGILFDRFSPQGLLFPREEALLELDTIINSRDLREIWAEDETIGWIYQYFNTAEERRAMREASPAPRNSRELAVRNQFFTPRYVVEFLTDNTLGRMWYEMRKGETTLIDKCRYLIRHPNEIFLNPGEMPSLVENYEKDLSQEELLKKAVFIEHCPKKDPRDIHILDPACGSGHFLLYSFDLLRTIYVEAWEDEQSPASEVTSKTLREDYPDLELLRKEIPRLIIEHNLYGIDIDARSLQIAALALWLQAQRAWQEQRLKLAERTRITKSNLVCAEPMPGEEDMRREFAESVDDKLGRLIQRIFKRMELAGEAGSLLRIEEETSSAIREIYGEHGDLYRVSDEERWRKAEEDLFKALQEYAERADGGTALRRRLFADDAAEGFAFVDLCRKKFDVVLMNPPFGELTDSTKKYLSSQYSNVSANILCAFVESVCERLTPSGTLASVVDRTILIKNSYEKFRRYSLLGDRGLNAVADLGWGVLDANVEVSTIVVGRPNTAKHRVTFGANLTLLENKDSELQHCCHEPRFLNLAIFQKMPFAAINFDVPKFFIRCLEKMGSLSEEAGVFYNGHTIKSDVFKRLFWEVSLYDSKTLWDRMWNGSEYSPFYVSMQEAVLTQRYGGGLLNHSSTIIRNPAKHKLPGLCFGKRGDFLDVQVLPERFVLTNEGFGGPFENSDKTWFVLSYLNSRVVQYMVNLYCGQHKGVGYVGRIPFPKISEEQIKAVGGLGAKLNAVLRSINRLEETDPLFIGPFAELLGDCLSLQEFDANYRRIQEDYNADIEELDDIIFGIVGVSEEEKELVKKDTINRPKAQMLLDYSSDNQGAYFTHSLISYSVGSCLARWDVRIALHPSLAPKLPDPFDPLPVCPPGMLVGPDGLPAESGRIVSEEWLRARPDTNTLPAEGAVKNPTVPDNGYPLPVSWNGILVDDPGLNGGRGYRDDIVHRVQEVMGVVWNERGEAIEHEACEVLGVSKLRDYFRRPTGFFQDHLKRYSKGRRKAPIYWPLSTTTGSYTLWIYYHRLTDQTLYACVNDYVNRKLEDVSKDIERLEEEVAKRATAKNRQRVEELTDFEQELKDFRDELLRVAALPYKPNLNDGVMITAAPLWELLRHNQWRKDLKACWKKLEAGEYDWAHLSYAIWPERVRGKCKTDLSIAIAHDLEDLYEGDVAKPKKRRKKAKS